MTHREFAHVLKGPPLPKGAVRNFADLIFGWTPRRGVTSSLEDALLLGHVGDRSLSVSGEAFRAGVRRQVAFFQRSGLRPGDTVALFRLPYTSEALLALTFAALAAYGLRVFAPVMLEKDPMPAWLRLTGCRVVFWSASEVRDHPALASELAHWDAQFAASGVRAYDLHDDLQVLGSLAPLAAGELDAAAQDEVLRRGSARESECVVLTTSGSTGRSKMVRHSQASFLRSCEAWEAAGLFAEGNLRGRCYSPLLSHSIGLRTFWNTIYTGGSMIYILPEWFLDRPQQVKDMLLDLEPVHLTAGPGVYRLLLRYAEQFPDFRERFFPRLRCAVSIGAPYDSIAAARFEELAGIRVDSGFGMTELLQVLTTVGGAHADPGSGALGDPLPGVEIGLEEFERPGLFRMYVTSPFGCSGFISDIADPPASSRSPQDWLETGDVVARGDQGDLLYVGREGSDFFKDSFGVKMPHSILQTRYADLDPRVVHVECFPLVDRLGLSALLFVTGADEPARGQVTEPEVLAHLASLLRARWSVLACDLDGLEFRLQAVTRFAAVGGDPPRLAKQNVSRDAIRKQHPELVSALVDPNVRRIGVIDLGSPHPGAGS